ncbi:MAG: glycosyltransferase [Microbacteriaceae bacterium]|nr:glycosyltransferase [Microbacteriaceae bacterium]
MTTKRPFFSVVTPVYNVALDILAETIQSVTSQAWPDWQLILIDDLSPNQAVRDFLATAAAADDRISVIYRDTNGGISAASNDGLAAATGEYVALLDHDDLLAHGALAQVAAVLLADPKIDYLYTDEDKVDLLGNHFETFAKPDWSPERLRSQMYCAHLSVVRLQLARDVGGFNSAYDGSQDHDFILKVTERAGRIHHLAEVLYHWRAIPESTASSGEAKPYTWHAGLAAVRAHVERIGLDATVELGGWFGTYAVHRRLDPTTRVSIVIPTRGTRGFVRGDSRSFVVEAVRSILAKTQHPNFEVVVVADVSTPADTMAELHELLAERLVVVPYNKPFNFSEKCNLGFLASTGDIVVMLNDDVEVIADNFLAELCGALSEKDVGMTGAYLLYESGMVQHAGHRYAERGYKHAFHEHSLGDPGPFCALTVDREVSGLTAACIAMRREVFVEVGGFSERLPANFNDVDLSLKVRAAGYRLVWLNRVRLYHFESQSRVAKVHQWELDILRQRWGIPRRDAYSEIAPPEPSRGARAGL